MAKSKKADELVIANKKLAFENEEKGKRAAELVIADKELVYQKKEKGKRAAELVIANKELAFQSNEKNKRAAELVIANKELLFQNTEKEKRAAELIVANRELLFQNTEKEKRAAELIIANRELLFKNEEKEKRAAELISANEELKKAKQEIVELNIGLEIKIIERTAQLVEANKELESFSYSVSHDLRAPLRAINRFTQLLLEDTGHQLDNDARGLLDDVMRNSKRMGSLIDNLLEFSLIGTLSLSIVDINIENLVNAVFLEQRQQEPDRDIELLITKLPDIMGDKNMIRQVFINLISNAFKYTRKIKNAVIEIGSYTEGDFCVYYVKDNGAGFNMKYYPRLFGVFQRLHSSSEFEGTGVGLAIIQRIVTKHGGKIWAEARVGEGACFYMSLPALPNKQE